MIPLSTTFGGPPPWTAVVPSYPAAAPTATISVSRTAGDVTFITTICPRCGGAHVLFQCPQVKAIEYQKGSRDLIGRVEFFEGTGSRGVEVTITSSFAMPPMDDCDESEEE